MAKKLVYCVYLTVFRGSELPPFYIGSTNMCRINDGYHGSVASREFKGIWRYQVKNFPEKFKTTVLSLHATRDDAAKREQEILKHFGAATHPLYINRTNSGNKFFSGLKHTAATKQKMSRAGKGKPKTDITKANISKGLIGKPKRKEHVMKSVATRKANGSYVPWNKGIKGAQTSWNKGLTKDTDSRLAAIGDSISAAKKGTLKSKEAARKTAETRKKNGTNVPWNKRK